MSEDSISTWAIHRRLYEWVLSFAASSMAPVALFFIAIMEAFMPFVPPDVLLIPMCLEKRRKSAFFVAIAIIGSNIGALVGFFIIAALFSSGTEWIFGVETIEALKGEFEQRGSMYVFIAALTPVPFFALTTAAGAAELNFGVFIAACLVGRTLRYGLEAGIVWWIGHPAKQFIEKWFNTITIATCVFILIGWYVVTQLAPNS